MAQCDSTYVSWKRILQETPPIQNSYSNNIDLPIGRQERCQTHVADVESLLDQALTNQSSALCQKYLSDFRHSIKTLQNASLDARHNILEEVSRQSREDLLTACREQLKSRQAAIREGLTSHLRPVEQLATKLGLGPRTGLLSLLSWLVRDSQMGMLQDWTPTLIELGITITRVQHAARLLRCGDDQQDVVEELSNIGYQNWNPSDKPEWLLMQLLGNFLIRPQQVQIAERMMNSQSQLNATMQLKMGQGKSSVIVPMIAARLADRKQLVRVVVLKQLTKPMLQILVTQLGGSLNRQVIYMPFSRSVKLTADKVLELQQALERCMHLGGVLLAQPEHILSFELYGIDQCLRNHDDAGHAAIGMQDWMDTHIRDVLDESDEILNPRYQLIYTIGLQNSIDVHPKRWNFVIAILDLLATMTAQSALNEEDDITFRQISGERYPHFHINEQSAGQALLDSLAARICAQGMPGLPLNVTTSQARQTSTISHTSLPNEMGNAHGRGRDQRE